jgi:diketogulonate reductase-like aldo/keto reductase
MVKELKGLTQVKAGRIMKEKEALQFCKKHNIKVISCRWVRNRKPEADEGVRARIIVKDFARGQKTVRQEGLFFPTPSIADSEM